MAKLGLSPKCSFQVSCTAVSHQTLGRVWGLHMSASPPSLGQAAGDCGPAAGAGRRSRRKGNLGDELPGSSVIRDWAHGADVVWCGLSERGWPESLSGWGSVCGTVTAAYRLLWRLLPLWGRPGRALQNVLLERGTYFREMALPADRGEMPGTDVHPEDAEKCLADKLQHTLFIFIWYIIFQNCLDRKHFWGYFLT